MSYAATDWVKHHATTTPDKLATIDLASGRECTYAAFHQRVGRAAGFLKASGIKKGDRVAFLALNSTDILDVIFGCWRIGAVCLAINFRLTATEIKFILDNAAADMVVYDKVFQLIADALEDSPAGIQWVMTDGMGGDSPFEKGLAAATPVLNMEPQALEDQCMLMYSSGTTGMPKGVIITHGMMYFSASAGSIVTESGRDNVSLCNMPLFHIGGLNVTGTPAIWGGTTAVIDRMFEPGKTLEYINDPKLGVTTLFLVPAAYNALRAHPNAETTDWSRIKVALCGAETVPTALVNWFYVRGIYIQEGYGMTETAAAGCMLDKTDIPAKVGSAGRSLRHSTIRVIDEAGQTCAPNVLGELWFKGACVTPGYWRRPEANEDSFVDGWFKSGDIGRMDQDGYIYIEDRIKDMYISGGENVYPAEIENLLYQMDAIAEVAVIGVPHDKWGEVGCVVAVQKSGASLCMDDISGHCGDKLAKFKQPHHLVILDELPRTATGKVLKFELRKTVPKQLGLD